MKSYVKMNDQMVESIEMLHFLGAKYADKYEKMSRSDLIMELVSRDNLIEELKASIKIKGQMEDEKIEIYKNKLSEEIEQNQKIIESFALITESIAEIINKLNIDEEEGSDILSKVRDSCKSLGNESRQKSEDQQQFGCFDQIVNETLKLLEYLSNALTHLKEAKNQFIHNDTKVLNEGSIVTLLQEKNSLTELLRRNQFQKTQLMKSIFQGIDKEVQAMLNKMDRDELIQQLLKKDYGMRELRSDKKKIFQKCRKQREEDHMRYQQLLAVVKNLKTQYSKVSSKISSP